jgi:hypothetical protein
MAYGVYISGPGIVGHILMRTAFHPKATLLVYETKTEASIQAELLRKLRPYHIVAVAPYTEGDENKGQYSAHPDGTTP